jgi:hypothetical protein
MRSNTDSKPTTVREAAAHLLSGLHRAPLGFLWGAVSLFPAVFCIVFGHCRRNSVPIAFIQAVLWVTVCSPIIAVALPFAALDGARIAVDSTEDHYGLRDLRSAFQGPDA